MNLEDNKPIRKEEMLEAYIRYSKHRGNARVLLKQRLEAILAAFNPELDKNVLKYFNLGYLIDKNCSEAKLNEIEAITGRKFEDESSDPYMSWRLGMFVSLLIYRLQLESIHDAYNGVYEYGKDFAYGMTYAQNVKVDRLIFLLLGDKYDKTFTVSELKEKYGYPSLSDQELQQVIFDDMPD